MSNELSIHEPVLRPYTPDAMAPRDELSIRGLLLILKRRRKTILGIMTVCFVSGVVLCLLMKPRYKALGEIQVQKSATDGVGLENLTGQKQESSDALEDNIELQTQATILQSYSLGLKVIDDLHLENTEDFKQKFNPIGWALGLFSPTEQQDTPNAILDDAPRRRDRAVGIFEKHLKIKPQSGTRLIDITYTSTDPKIAAAVVNDIGKSLLDYTLQSRFTATNEVSSWLSGQLADIKKEAEQRQGKLEQLQRESGVYSLGIPDATGKEMAYSATLDRLQQATEELSTASSNRILKGALYKTIQNGDPELISGLAGSSLAGSSPAVNSAFLLLQNLRLQQATLASQVASDVSKYGSSNPKLEDDKASLDSINAQISSEVNRIGDRAANDYKAAQMAESSIRDVYDQTRKAADVLNDKAVALLIARQEASDSRSLYQTLYTHLKEAGVIEGLRSSNIAVVDPGRIPSKPIPYILIIPALALIVGGFIGMAVALFLESVSDRIEIITTVENDLRTRVLAILPNTIADPASRALGGFVSNVGRRLGIGDQTWASRSVEVLDGPNTAYVEAIRGLRTSLLRPQNGIAPKTILITGPGEREGKSTLSMNLAASLVNNGSRVLLIDADMRSSGLSGYMGLEPNSGDLGQRPVCGLSKALSSAAPPETIKPFTELPELSVIPAGPVPKFPAELLGSSRMRRLVEDSSANYDFVLIDSPPVLAVSDAVILSRLVDMTLLVAMHGKSTQRSLERAYRTLHEVEGRKVGIILNGVRTDSVSFNEFYGYNGSSYYSKGAK